jgi:hypothetical protein
VLKSFQPQDQPLDAKEIVRLWARPDGTRCVLAATGSEFEVLLIKHEHVVRRAPCLDLRRARDIGQRWRVDDEMAQQPAVSPRLRTCPDCGDDGEPDPRGQFGALSLRCPSCGNVWFLAESLR